MKATLIGPYASHNFGDDLIGAVLAECLRQRFDAEVLIPGMSRTNCEWLGIDFSSSSFDAISNSKITIIGGGGILGDSGIYPSNKYLKKILKSAILSHICRNRVIITAVGAGPLIMPSSRLFCQLSCYLAEYIGVRDEISARFLAKELGVPADKITSGADVALLWPDVLRIPNTTIGKGGIQFDARLYGNIYDNDKYKDILKCISEYYKKRKDDTVLITNNENSSELGAFIDSPFYSAPYYSLNQFLPLISGLKYIITSHLHLAIASYAARVPCFSVYVREKTARFYEQIGHPERALDLRVATRSEVERFMDMASEAVWLDSDEMKLQELKGRAGRMLDICAYLFG
jgi:polysaccharide pyruvyl transferase WcaK-like protein